MAKKLITQRALLSAATEAAKLAGLPEDMIVLLGDERDPRFKHFNNMISPPAANFTQKAAIGPARDLAFLVYSSGTTGLPKGVEISHGNMVANITQAMGLEDDTLTWDGGPDGTGDRWLAFLPFSHIYGKSLAVAQIGRNWY